jgi:hypothetical protein
MDRDCLPCGELRPLNQVFTWTIQNDLATPGEARCVRGCGTLNMTVSKAMRRLISFIAAAAMPILGAQAQIPASTLVSGQSRPALAQATPGGAWCFVGRGLSNFQSNANGTQATVSLAEVTYFDGTNYFLLNGQTRLVFSSPDSGNIKFKQTPEYSLSVTNPPFSNYAETVQDPANLIAVSFSVNFPSCTLPVYILYEIQ